MNREKRYSIGEFSEKAGLSKRTLHYYEEIGLLKPARDEKTGRRFYSDRDIATLQKITALKFLGFSLKEIRRWFRVPKYDFTLLTSLKIQLKIFEEKKEQIETVIRSLRRIIRILEEEGEIDNLTLMSLIHSMQTEKDMKEQMKQIFSEEFVEELFEKQEREIWDLDKSFVQLTKEAKRLVGRPPEDPEVQAVMEKYFQSTLNFIGEEGLKELAHLTESDLQAFDQQLPSPFTREEEEWLAKAMEHYMRSNPSVFHERTEG
ncbi:MerR family transcriptional regulator [Caldibacillus debilis]|uniref:Putative transcriptional regulator n=1 Tax=Caldibacillus debilis GB1 TaxID=1339248 RepID=A0A420VFH3_9BACI|nr:MerR family transcriptional regulator [Caldibacillus debilis]RKO62306.1 putative transcriptional regulator [Caldibacillus debilis GB1]